MDRLTVRKTVGMRGTRQRGDRIRAKQRRRGARESTNLGNDKDRDFEDRQGTIMGWELMGGGTGWMEENG